MIDVGGVALIIIAILILVAVLKLGAILDWIKRDRVAGVHEASRQHRQLFPDSAPEPWPGCQCSVRWDNDGDRAIWTTCGSCTRRVGRHEAPWSVPLDDRPAEAIIAVVTDLKKRQKP